MLEDVMQDDTVKGFPPHQQSLLSQVGGRGWNLLRGDIPLPAAVIKLPALERNSRWMQAFVKDAEALLAPHVKTTMCPAIMRRQLADGAWGVTVATVQQMRVCRRWGAARIILANQPVGVAELAGIMEELRQDPGLDFYCLADSSAGVALLAQAALRKGLERPVQVLVELGYTGGRTGARGVNEALTVARAVHQAGPALALAGVEGFEGMLPVAAPLGQPTVHQFLADMATVYRRCRDEGLFGVAQPLLTAGGSIHYDLVLEAFAGLEARVVTRSGCYVTQDSGIYQKAHDALRAKRDMAAGLERALEVWAYVQSRPEPGLALLTAGRRDFGTDAGLPVPLLRSRDGATPVSMDGLGWEIVGVNDQHAYLRVPASADLKVGDRVGLGVSHPCTTLDKWQLLLVVDDDYTVVDAYRTYF
ncbi:amino acid deaminase [Nitrospirillum sp. BR 11163]|uniref:amino acid deaminase n=1 Tax=Nitrospirillum sp. BR 11163 TaxID=3104323 RepID=UPI002AFEC9A5|nr:amino acid deaminase [Nitrospirillum sp. BR 11163]MEA1672722.1 amino acid deaminase [Nitrospirillum sp. BR 11163]